MRFLINNLKVTLATGLVFFISCNQVPTGPSIPEERKLALFCILDPSLQSQILQLSRTLTFKEQQNNFEGDLEIQNAEITLTGPAGIVKGMRMDVTERPERTRTVLYGTDYLWGGGHFNYLLDGIKVEEGDHYRISVTSPEYGEAHAETTVPGPFEITEINIDPERTDAFVGYDRLDLNWPPPPEKVLISWSPSQDACGYLVDFMVLDYDFSQWEYIGHGSEEDTLIHTFTDTSNFVSVPYEVMPVNFGSEGQFQRGCLVRETSLEIPLERFIAMTGFKVIYNQRFYWLHLKRIKVQIHALDEALYNYTAFQYLNLGQEEVVGREASIPDLSNIAGDGVGLFGSCRTSEATSRLFNFVLDKNLTVDENSYSNELYNRINFPPYHPLNSFPPVGGLTPEDEAILEEEEGLVLSWETVEEATHYLLVLKPNYLWFWPGNHAYLLQENRYELMWQEFGLRNSRIEWYVMALDMPEPNTMSRITRYHLQFGLSNVLELPPDKAPLVVNGMFSDVNNVTPNHGSTLTLSNGRTPWSETRCVLTSPGDLPGFESEAPLLLSPSQGEEVINQPTLKWTFIPGADLYLVMLEDENNTQIFTVSEAPEITFPFTEGEGTIEGLNQVDHLASGKQYTLKVCALRVKSGCPAFIIKKPDGEALPKIYPRYEHPSGVMLMSRYSEPVSFIVR